MNYMYDSVGPTIVDFSAKQNRLPKGSESYLKPCTKECNL